MSKSMGKELEEWFGCKPKPHNLKIEDLKALKIVTTNWELVKDDERFQYKLKKSNQKESTQAEAKAKRKQSETNAAPSPPKTPTKRQKKGENKTV